MTMTINFSRLSTGLSAPASLVLRPSPGKRARLSSPSQRFPRLYLQCYRAVRSTYGFGVAYVTGFPALVSASIPTPF